MPCLQDDMLADGATEDVVMTLLVEGQLAHVLEQAAAPVRPLPLTQQPLAGCCAAYEALSEAGRTPIPHAGKRCLQNNTCAQTAWLAPSHAIRDPQGIVLACNHDEHQLCCQTCHRLQC